MNFCVKCGEEAEQTMGGLCAACFLDGRKLMSLPHHVDLNVCANCGDIGRGESWVTKDLPEAIEEAAKRSVVPIKEAKVVRTEASSVEQEPYTYAVTVDALLDIGGHAAEDSASTIVRIKNTVCKRCSRQLGNYYEAILQIRADPKNVPHGTVREALNRVENLVDANSVHNRQLFITKSEEVQGGIDVYLSSISLGKAAAKDLADAYCAETKEAFKLVGQTDDGQGMYRITYLVRLPDFHAGDVILFEGRYFKLTRVSGSGAKVIDLMNFRERAVKRSDMPSFKVHERAEDLREAVVVSKGKGEIQILDPSNYSTADLNVPDGAEIGDTVKVAEIDNILYYVP
ncbi:MAG: NMD3-related protein [Methanomassiliicoccaceae archaeon]|nr:NMD3-related protein [Methanomassiliicoccaceae archaeon]